MFNINCQISLNLKLDKLNSIYYNGIYPGRATSCKEKSLLIIIIGLVLNFIQYMKNTPHPNPGNSGSQKLNFAQTPTEKGRTLNVLFFLDVFWSLLIGVSLLLVGIGFLSFLSWYWFPFLAVLCATFSQALSYKVLSLPVSLLEILSLFSQYIGYCIWVTTFKTLQWQNFPFIRCSSARVQPVPGIWLQRKCGNNCLTCLFCLNNLHSADLFPVCLPKPCLPSLIPSPVSPSLCHAEAAI